MLKLTNKLSPLVRKRLSQYRIEPFPQQIVEVRKLELNGWQHVALWLEVTTVLVLCGSERSLNRILGSRSILRPRRTIR